MRELFSKEAEQGVLGAILIKPELADILTADLVESDFFYRENREVFAAIRKMQAQSRAIDFLTVAEFIGIMENGDHALGYTGELHHKTPSVANAMSYARIVQERSVERALVAASKTVFEIATGEGTAEDKISQAQAELAGVNMAVGSCDTITAAQALTLQIDEYERRERLGGALDGLTTGIADLDAAVQGLKPEQLIVVAGRPKMGKTTLAMNLADHAAVECERQVLVFSLEMSRKQLMDKQISSLGRIPLRALRNGSAFKDYSSELGMVTNMISKSGMAIYARPSATDTQIRSVCRRHKNRHGLDLVIVDHIGLVNVDDPRTNSNAVARVSQITRSLKLMAKELGCPVIALSQLNRELEKRPDKRPIPSDLRDSGSIEQDADMVWFVYRDAVYNPSSNHGRGEIIIGVARDLEPATIHVGYSGAYSRFYQLSDEQKALGSDYSETPKPTRGMDF